MAFWGVELMPGVPYTHRFDPSKGRLCVSMGILGSGGTETTSSIVQCIVGNDAPINICCVSPLNRFTPLKLEFEEMGNDIVFTVIGPWSIHLSGHYLRPPTAKQPEPETEEEQDDIGEADSERSGKSYEYQKYFLNDDDSESEQYLYDYLYPASRRSILWGRDKKSSYESKRGRSNGS